MDDRNAPATKGDLIDFRAEANERLDILRSEVNHNYADLKESMRDIQTELLKAFYNYSQTTDIRLKGNEMADFNTRERLTVLESRITDIEKRLNMPPQPPN